LHHSRTENDIYRQDFLPKFPSPQPGDWRKFKLERWSESISFMLKKKFQLIALQHAVKSDLRNPDYPLDGKTPIKMKDWGHQSMTFDEALSAVDHDLNLGIVARNMTLIDCDHDNLGGLSKMIDHCLADRTPKGHTFFTRTYGYTDSRFKQLVERYPFLDNPRKGFM